MLNSMSRKSSISSLGGTPRSLTKRAVTQQSEKCPYCGRIFGFKGKCSTLIPSLILKQFFFIAAYDRHVEWCKEKSLIKPSPDMASVSAAKERMKIRVNYKAPNLKSVNY